MTVLVNWGNTHRTILHFQYMNSWTWEEAYEAIQKSQTMMNAVTHPVAMVVDLRSGQKLPPDPMVHLKQVVENRANHPNDSGITIFLDAEVLTKAMLDFVSMGDPAAAKFVIFKHAKTLEDAIYQATSALHETNEAD